LAIDPITLTEGDLHDIGEMVCDVTSEALQYFMQENQTMLGSVAEHMLRAWIKNMTMLPEGALVIANVTDRFSVSMLNGLGLNLVALLREMLYQLQDGIIAKLRSRESHTIKVLSEQKINMEQLSL